MGVHWTRWEKNVDERLPPFTVPANEPVNTFRDRVRAKASRGLVPLCCVAGLGCFLAQTAKADFISPYPLTDFTFTNTNANGTVSTPDGGLSINLVGGQNGTGEPGTTDFVTTAQAAGLVQFQWSYFSLDVPGADDAGYLLGGVFTELSDTSGDSGLASFTVTFGETFGFRAATVDNQSRTRHPDCLGFQRARTLGRSGARHCVNVVSLFAGCGGGGAARRWFACRKAAQ